MPTSDDWVELFTLERPPVRSDDGQLIAIQLAVRGLDLNRNVDPKDVRADLICGRDAELRSWLRVSVRRNVYDGFGPTVTRLPLDELVHPAQGQALAHVRSLSVGDLKNLLRSAPVQFVFAAIGDPIAWIDGSLTFEVWKAEVQAHLADPTLSTYLDDYEGDYLYFASQWTSSEGDVRAVVVFEKHH